MWDLIVMLLIVAPVGLLPAMLYAMLRPPWWQGLRAGLLGYAVGACVGAALFMQTPMAELQGMWGSGCLGGVLGEFGALALLARFTRHTPPEGGGKLALRRVYAVRGMRIGLMLGLVASLALFCLSVRQDVREGLDAWSDILLWAFPLFLLFGALLGAFLGALLGACVGACVGAIRPPAAGAMRPTGAPPRMPPTESSQPKCKWCGEALTPGTGICPLCRRPAPPVTPPRA